MINKIINRVKENPVVYILKAVAVVLGIVTLFYFFNKKASTRGYPQDYLYAGIFMLIGILLNVASILLDDKKFTRYIEVAASICISVATMFFLLGSILSIVDHVWHIVMWGDPARFPAIVAFGIMAVIAMGSNIAVCWIKD